MTSCRTWFKICSKIKPINIAASTLFVFVLYCLGLKSHSTWQMLHMTLLVHFLLSVLLLLVGILKDALYNWVYVIPHNAFAAFSQIHSVGYYCLQYASTNTNSYACMKRDVAGTLEDCYSRNKTFRGRGTLSNKIDITGKTFGGTNTITSDNWKTEQVLWDTSPFFSRKKVLGFRNVKYFILSRLATS